MYSCIADHNFEKELRKYENEDIVKWFTTKTKVNLKSGKVQHMVLKLCACNENIEETVEVVKNLYDSVSGRPRIYVDNTIEFLESLLKEED